MTKSAAKKLLKVFLLILALGTGAYFGVDTTPAVNAINKISTDAPAAVETATAPDAGH